jgi:hypothetical protein
VKAYLLLFFAITATVVEANGKPSPQQISFPSPTTQTIPASYLDAMNRQEQRLDEINGKLIAMDTSLRDFKEVSQKSFTNIDTKLNDFTATNVVMKFILAIIVLLVPTVVGVWLNERLKRKPVTA